MSTGVDNLRREGAGPSGSLDTFATVGAESTPSGDLREGSAALHRLLEASPVDLAAISQEIRRRPELESLVMLLGESLGHCADENVKSIEDAVVVLGTQSLRLVVDLWTLRSSRSAVPDPKIAAKTAATVARLAPGAEYVESLLRRLGVQTAGTDGTPVSALPRVSSKVAPAAAHPGRIRPATDFSE